MNNFNSVVGAQSLKQNSTDDAIFNGMQNPRTDYTIIRGKNVLVSPSEEQFDLLKKRLEERTLDCRGETIYEIGVGEGNIFYFI